jgi:hypothetical protein
MELSAGVERFAEALGEEGGFEAGGAEDGTRKGLILKLSQASDGKEKGCF